MDAGPKPGPSQIKTQGVAAEPIPLKPAMTKSRRSFKSFGEVHREQMEKRRSRTKPPPWIARKLAVFIVIGLIIFATYVYVARACLPLIRRQDDIRGGGRKVGVAFLCVYWVLWVMCVWTYTKAIITPPGFARDYVEKSPAPTVAGPAYSNADWDTETHNTSIDPYEYGQRNRIDFDSPASLNRGPAGQPVPTGINSQPSDVHTSQQDDLPDAIKATTQAVEKDASELNVFPPIANAHARRENRIDGEVPGGVSNSLGGYLVQPGDIPRQAGQSSRLPPVAKTRQPPRHPILAEQYRYCQRDGFVKPIRAHHCRICATCVLNFDHHCPWIGQCVGARNRKFFLNFVLWGCLYCSWIAFSLIALQVQNGSSMNNVDPLQVVVIALTGIFALFTLGLFVTHSYLITLNLTTIEEYGIKSMQEREDHMLSSLFPWWNCRAKVQMRRTWDEEWGALKTEGNIWWLGGRRKNWEQVMGKNPWGWILPIGKGETDGLQYPINPRFTPDGRWRPRAEWDPELRVCK